MGTNECSQPASKSSWDSQDFGDISMVLKMANFRKSTGPWWVNSDGYFQTFHCGNSCAPIDHSSSNSPGKEIMPFLDHCGKFN